MTDDSFLKWSMSERPRRLKRWAHFVRCEIPLHKDEQESLGDGTDLASELEEAAEALTKLAQEREENWQRYVDADAALLDAQDEIATLSARVKELEAQIAQRNAYIQDLVAEGELLVRQESHRFKEH